MTSPASRTFSAALRSFRTERRINGVELAKLAGIPPRSISRWERRRVRPREREARKLIAVIATMSYPVARELSNILEIPPPPDPATPPPPVPAAVRVAVAPAPPVAPAEASVAEAPPAVVDRPLPGELAIDPVEAAVLRAAESLDMSPRLLRPVLARFLGHLAALDVAAGDAVARLG